MKTVLVVDDEPGIIEIARDYLEHAGFGVITATDHFSDLGGIAPAQTYYRLKWGN